jgi:hypothetical protein
MLDASLSPVPDLASPARSKTMYALWKIINQLTMSAEQRRLEREEAYLAEAVDLYDLEARMRDLDRRASRNGASWFGHNA